MGIYILCEVIHINISAKYSLTQLNRPVYFVSATIDMQAPQEITKALCPQAFFRNIDSSSWTKSLLRRGRLQALSSMGNTNNNIMLKSIDQKILEEQTPLNT